MDLVGVGARSGLAHSESFPLCHYIAAEGEDLNGMKRGLVVDECIEGEEGDDDDGIASRKKTELEGDEISRCLSWIAGVVGVRRQ